MCLRTWWTSARLPIAGVRVSWAEVWPERERLEAAGARAMADMRASMVTVNGVSASIMTHYAEMVGEVGTWKASNDADFKAAQANESFMEEYRESVSGVSMEEELTNLIAFQRGFQANSRVVSAVNEMLQTVIQMV